MFAPIIMVYEVDELPDFGKELFTRLNVRFIPCNVIFLHCSYFQFVF